MILKETRLKVADNSGARLVKCIQILNKTVGREGDSIIITVKKAFPKKKAQKGKVYKGIVVQCKKVQKRLFGHSLYFGSNRVILLKKLDNKKMNYVPLGTRIFFKLSFFLRLKGFLKLLLISLGQL